MVKQTSHECRNSSEERAATSESPYHFIDSGLPNVFLVGINFRVCESCGMQSADIPAIKNLLMVIARTIVENEAPLTGPEIRFLRKRIGEKATDFSKHIGVTPEQVSRWENGHNPPELSADRLIRIMYSLSSDDDELKAKINRQIGPWLAAWGKGQLASIRASLHDQHWEAQPVPA